MLGVRARHKRPFSSTACDGPAHVHAFCSGLVRPVLKHGPKSLTVGQVFLWVLEPAAQATDFDLESRMRKSISVWCLSLPLCLSLCFFLFVPFLSLSVSVSLHLLLILIIILILTLFNFTLFCLAPVTKKKKKQGLIEKHRVEKAPSMKATHEQRGDDNDEEADHQSPK